MLLSVSSGFNPRLAREALPLSIGRYMWYVQPLRIYRLLPLAPSRSSVIATCDDQADDAPSLRKTDLSSL